MIDLKNYIRDIPDWPEKGVNFKDITPLLRDKDAFKYAVDKLAEPYRNQKIDTVVGIDARGFILASAVAYTMGCGLVLVRKKGKLPWKTVSFDYKLEYGSNTVEMHEDAIVPGQKVLIVDDVLATGGTMQAAVELVKKLGGEIIGVEFLIVIEALNGREKLQGCEVKELINF